MLARLGALPDTARRRAPRSDETLDMHPTSQASEATDPRDTDAATPPEASGAAPSPRPGLGRRALGVLRSLALYLLAFLVLSTVIGQLRAPALPAQAPPFSLSSLDGQRYDLQALRGRKVVLNFWARWCPPCRAEVPMIRSFAQSHPEVVVLGIAADGSPAELRAAGEDLGITYPILLGQPSVLQAYQASTLPTTVVIDENGQVEMVHVGVITPLQLWWATW